MARRHRGPARALAARAHGHRGRATQLWVLGALTLRDLGPGVGSSSTSHQLIWRNLAQTHPARAAPRRLRPRAGAGARFFEDAQTRRPDVGASTNDVNQLERFLDGGASDLLKVHDNRRRDQRRLPLPRPSVAWMAMVPMPFILWFSLRLPAQAAAALRGRARRGGGAQRRPGRQPRAASPPSRASRPRSASVARMRAQSEAYRAGQPRRDRPVLGLLALIRYGDRVRLHGHADLRRMARDRRRRWRWLRIR
jgi:ATP-binding cassette subfamily B protein